MIRDKQLLLAIKEIATSNGFGTVVSIFNEIEEKWYTYVGQFKPKNPSNNIYFSTIEGKCIDYILENKFNYFAGELAKNELISSKIEDLPIERIEFDFKFVWLK